MSNVLRLSHWTFCTYSLNNLFSLFLADHAFEMATRKSSMVGSITSLLKQVHLFNYSQNTSTSVDSLDMGFNSIPSSSSLASDDSLSQETQYQAISYSDSNFSVGTPSDYDSPSHISESLTSYTDFSDAEEDNLDDCVSPAKRIQEKTKQSLPQYSLNEVAQHDMMHDCWIVFYDKVRLYFYS